MSDTNEYKSAGNQFSKEEEKLWSVLVHAVAIVFEFFAPVLGFLLFRDKGPFIRHHVTESLNFGLTMVVFAIGLAISVIGWLVIWALPIYWTVFRIVASYRASQGDFYHYPLTIRFVKN